MARIQYSGLIDNIRGSIGGTTFQNNKYGYTVKRKPNMVNPNTSLQQRSKNILSEVSRAWRDLSSAERTAYNTFASTYPQYSKYNPTSVLSGYAVFLKYNTLRVLRSNPVLESFSGAPPATDTLSYIIDSTSGTLRIYIDSTTNDEEWDILFFVSRQFSVGQNFVGTRTRYFEHDVNFDGNTDVTALWEAMYGDIPTSGDRVAMDALLIAGDVPYVLARDSQVYTVATGT